VYLSGVCGVVGMHLELKAYSYSHNIDKVTHDADNESKHWYLTGSYASKEDFKGGALQTHCITTAPLIP